MRCTIDEELAHAEAVRQARLTFPDLVRKSYRFNMVRYASMAATSLCTDVEMSHTCGCCDDAPYYARPFLKIGDLEVYSDQEFYLGDKRGFDRHDWEPYAETMLSAGVPQSVVDKVISYQTREESRHTRRDLDEDDQ